MKIRMRRGIAVAGLLALLAVTAVAPASADVPGGKGLDSTFGPFECEGLEGTVTFVGSQSGPTAWMSTGEHAVPLSFSGIVTDPDGNVFTFSRNFGTKAGMNPFTCTTTYEYPDGSTEEFTMVIAIVPPTL